MRFVVVILSGHETFIEAATALLGTLKDLGHDAIFADYAFVSKPSSRRIHGRENRRWIAFGAHHAPTLNQVLPEDAILYNTEQVGSGWFTYAVRALFARHTVWDYSAENAKRYGELGLKTPHVVQFGYHNSLERNTVTKYTKDCDIEVLHIGSINDRRQKLLDALRARGVHVMHVFGVYGEERDKLLNRCRIALHVHFYESAIYPSLRLVDWVANHHFVVCEQSVGDEHQAGLSVPYDGIVDAVCDLLSLTDGRVFTRRCIDHYGYRFFDLHLSRGRFMNAIAQALFNPEPAFELTLCMIVKNESKVIIRCLNSVMPFIDSWCIVDTGSTDGTQDIIRNHMAIVPGKLVEEPWVREDINRTQAFEHASRVGKHILWIDADEVLQEDPGFELPPKLTEDAYNIMIHYGSNEYARPQILRSKLPWRWRGVVHGGVEALGARPAVLLSGIRTIPSPDGASWSDPDKYKRHVELLEEECAREPDNTRSRYYLAQSYRDSSCPEKAREVYRYRARMPGGWDEETWSALYEAAKLTERIAGRHRGAILAGYAEAFFFRPTRAEPLYRLGKYLRIEAEHHLAFTILNIAANIPKPPDLLFIEHDIYGWMILDELALAAHGLGQNNIAILIVQRAMLLAPDTEQKRLKENKKAFGG